MTNENEKQWQELVEKAAMPRLGTGCYHDFLEGAQFVRENLSSVPEVRELVELVSNASSAGYFLNNESLGNGIKETLKALEGGK